MLALMKYEKELLHILDKEFKSTNQIREELSKITGKAVNWLSLARWLEFLTKENKVEMKKLSNIFFWKKKNGKY